MKIRVLVLAVGVLGVGSWVRAIDPEGFTWPAVTKETRPWTRWWWLGSAVDEGNLTELLEKYHSVGFGGVEICPIYGAKGAESRYLPFLSDKWVGMLAHTLREGERLGMGVDLTTGTGWPFGGPWVGRGEASMKFVVKRVEGTGGTPVVRGGESAGGTPATRGSRGGSPVPREGVRYEVVTSAPIQKVKRAAPGGEGNVVDPYSAGAMGKYLAPFEGAMGKLGGMGAPMPRGHFHDSFEYYGANWTPEFLEEFKKLRGYDLGDHLAAMAGVGEGDVVARVKHDYRETISDLHLEYLKRWVEFAHAHHGVARNQAHGGPGNLLDAYAVSDIPETEIFGEAGGQSRVMLMFASSAAHVGGKRLASAEAFTWLGEHFRVSLADCKAGADLLFVSGINHIFYHGVPYSPRDVAWPGWLFYAAVNFGPEGGLFRDLGALNGYITRVQSVLQAGRPDNEVLLYWPVDEVWEDGEGMLKMLSVHDVGKWLEGTGFCKSAEELIGRGYGVDFVSDRQLGGAKVEDGRIVVGGNRYGVVVVPPVRVMGVGTARKLAEISKAGGKVVVQGEGPVDVPGFLEVEKRRGELREAMAGVVRGDLKGVVREEMVEAGLRFARRKWERGYYYFISNPGGKGFEGWVPVGRGMAAGVLMDPMGEDRIGVAAVRRRADSEGSEVYVQLAPGGSVCLRTFTEVQASGPGWGYFEVAGKGIAVEGEWGVEFLEGGPVLPKGFRTEKLSSWAEREDVEARRFAGTGKYTIKFNKPGGRAAADWLLDLGRVAESARVRVNGEEVATLWARPFEVRVGKYLREGENTLEVEVTNLAANRVADLDRRGVPWKAFHEINFVNKDYKPFDASGWGAVESGLIGPVRLVPLKQIHPGLESH